MFKKLKNIYPWFIIVLATLLLFYKYMLQVFPSVITDNLIRDFNLTGAGLGNLAAMFFYSYLVMQFFSGYLVDQFGLKPMVIFSVIISAMGAFLFSYGRTYEVAILARLLMGIGAAFATVGYMKIAAINFPAKRFALVGGLLTIGVMLGAVFGQAPLVLLIQSVGWRQALLFVSLAGFVISCLFYIFIKNKSKFNSGMAEQIKPIKLSDIVELIKRKTNWFLMLYSGFAFAPLAVFGGLWGVPFMVKAYSLSESHAALYVSFSYVGFGVGGPLFGYLSDQIGSRFQCMYKGLLLSLLMICAVVFVPLNHYLLIICIFLFGLGTGAFMLGFAVGKDINPIHMTATVVAFINSADAIFGAISEPFIGKMLDVNAGLHLVSGHFSLYAYHIAFITLPIELLLAYLFLTQAEHARNLSKSTSKHIVGEYSSSLNPPTIRD